MGLKQRLNREKKTKMTQKKILVIDDDESIRALLTASLGDHYDIIEAYDGLSGIEMAQTEKPDLLICDLLMPTMTGAEFIEMAKKEKIIPEIPLLVVTASQYVSPEKLLIAKEDIIYKPFTIENLLEKVAAKLN